MKKLLSKKVRQGKSDAVFMTFVYAFSAIFAVLCLYPFLQVIMSSLTEESTLLREGHRLFPSKLSFAAYRAVFSSSTILTSYGVTIFITVFGTLLQMLVTGLAAYALAGKRLKYRNIFNFFFYFTMLFSGGLVASYILIKDYLHLDNTVLVYFVPTAFNAYNCFLLRNFFNDIPDSLLESAKLDGAGELIVFFRIALPLSVPALAAVSLFAAVGYWNEWYMGMLYVTDGSLYSLQYRIVRLLQSVDEANNLLPGQAAGDIPAQTVRYATAIITVGPIILLYPFLQKHFVVGLRLGGVKE